jgi:hypothetical protein
MSDEMLKDMNQGGADQQMPATVVAGQDPHEALAAHIIAEAKKQGIKAEVAINKIPANIAANILEFLRRVELKGMEAIAWGEAYSFMQQHVPQAQPTQQGVPFNGLPKK